MVSNLPAHPIDRLSTSCAVGPESPIPLAVDLDGTLIASDVTIESLFLLAKKSLRTLLKTLLWLDRGKASFKERLAREASPDVDTLPYDRDFLSYLRQQKEAGRSLILATGADRAVANAVAAYLGCFDRVLASDGQINLTGEHKRDRLVSELGVRGFDYAGNAEKDQSVWRAARHAVLVRPSKSCLRHARSNGLLIDRVFERGTDAPAVYFRTLRVGHWAKNALVFLPLIASHRLFAVDAFASAVLAFVAFGLCASSLYVINDLLDLPEDRRHPHKNGRPLASGAISPAQALFLVPPLFLGAAVIAHALPATFAAVLAGYTVLMLVYSLRLRNIAYLDVATLGTGYALRVVGGAVGTGVAVSPWLFAFCFLFFAGLAFLKRYADLIAHRGTRGDHGRVHAYSLKDGMTLATLGIGDNCAALLLLAYHYGTDGDLRGRHVLLWGVLLLLIVWLIHIWRMARCGRIVDDPVAFALTDRASLAIGALSIIALLAAG